MEIGSIWRGGCGQTCACSAIRPPSSCAKKLPRWSRRTTASSGSKRRATSSRPVGAIYVKTGNFDGGRQGAFPAGAGAESEIPAGMFFVSTRRGKQFNSMVHAEKDAITGAMRDAVDERDGCC